jgi:hypothetical protein
MNITVEGVELPNKPLTNFELEDAAKALAIHNFRGGSMRNTLPKKQKTNECGILNLDATSGGGTHWVAWYKTGKTKLYFDSFGVQPPVEILEYLKSPIHYNTEEIQPRDQVFCGHLCLYVLKHLSNGEGFQDIINTLY